MLGTRQLISQNDLASVVAPLEVLTQEEVSAFSLLCLKLIFADSVLQLLELYVYAATPGHSRDPKSVRSLLIDAWLTFALAALQIPFSGQPRGQGLFVRAVQQASNYLRDLQWMSLISASCARTTTPS